MNRNSLLSSEAGIKYFILGALSSGLLLFGISYIYGFSGNTNFNLIAVNINPESLGLIIGIVFVLAGLAFKVSAVPFHMWTPDVYQGAPTPITGFFALLQKLLQWVYLLDSYSIHLVRFILTGNKLFFSYQSHR